MKIDNLILLLIILNICSVFWAKKCISRDIKDRVPQSNKRFRKLTQIMFLLGKRSRRVLAILNNIGGIMGIPKQLQSESVYAVFGIEGLDTFDFEQDIWCGRHAREDMKQYLTQSNKQLFFVGGVVRRERCDCHPLANLLPENCRFASIHETLVIAKRLRLLGEKRIILCNGWGHTDYRTQPASTYYTHRIALVENKIVSVKAEGSFSFFIEKNCNDEMLSLVEMLVAVVRK